MKKFTTIQEVKDFLKNYDKPLSVVVTYRGELKMNKKDVLTKTIPNPNGVVFKEQEMKIVLNADYETIVNMYRLEEGKKDDFEAQKRVWGESQSKSIVENNGKEYFKGVLSESCVLGYWDMNNYPVDYQKLVPFIPKPSSNKTQGLDNPVRYVTIEDVNILKMESSEFVFVK